MKITIFSIKKSIAEAEKEASRKGLLARIFSGRWSSAPIMRTIYIENKLITFEITAEPSFVARMLKKATAPRKTKIEMIANGSTCGVSYYDRRGVETEEAEVDCESVQFADFSDEQMITRCNVLARRILRRRVGGNMSLRVIDVKSIFRPYHVAFFDKPEPGKKVYYIPVAADGCCVRRTF